MSSRNKLTIIGIQEIPDGYGESYGRGIARLRDVEDIDDLADPSEYYFSCLYIIDLIK